MAAWKFRPGLWPTVATLLLLPLLISLGFWQIDRAHQKEAMQQAFLEKRKAEPLDLAAARDLRGDRKAMMWRECLLRGHYLTSEQFLLDDVIEKGVPGYLVYTPFQLQGQDTLVLVNRGWIPAGPRRDVVPDFPTPAGPQRIRGVAKAPQSAGIALGGPGGEKLGGGLVRVQHLDLAGLAKPRHWDLLPYVVRLEPEAGSGFVRDWIPPGFGRMRHLGYAFQWFAMAAVLVGIYVVLNTERKTPT